MPKLNSKLPGGLRSAKIALCAVAAVGLAGISAARADTTDILLQELRAKGVLTKHEFSKLKARHAAEKAAYHRAGPPMGMVVKGPAPEYVTVCPKHICMRVGQVDVSLSGDLVFAGMENFKAHAGGNPATAGLVLGGLAGGSTVNNQNAFGAGLLPSALVLSLSTNQMGYDLGFTIGAYTGGNNVGWGALGANSGGFASALGTPGIDLRQIFGTVGTPTVGTFKIGRDLGLFGGDAILNDATLLGVGSAPGTITGNGNTTLGRIGLGYVYADWLPGVSYTTPDYNGFTATIGAFSPLNTAVNLAAPFSGVYTGQDTPMVQGRLKYVGNVSPDLKLTLSTAGIWQQHRLEAATFFQGAGAKAQSVGIDGFGRADFYGFSLVGYGYYGSGLGTTGLFFDGFSPNGQARKSYGGYVQGQYTFYKNFTIGGSWGISALESNSFDVLTFYNPFLLRSNESFVGFARYQLTTWMALQGEYTHTISKNQSGGNMQEDTFALGTAWFF